MKITNKKDTNKFIIMLSIISIVLITGCATVSKIINNAIDNVITDTVDEIIDETSVVYVVKKGDCLWDIAGKSNVYDNNFLWPLIYKYNSEQIEDVNVIEIGQKLKIVSLLQIVAKGGSEDIMTTIKIAEDYDGK